MQSALTSSPTPHADVHTSHATDSPFDVVSQSLNHYQILRRNGAVVPFEPSKIAVAMMKAFWQSTAHKARPRPACAKPLTC